MNKNPQNLIWIDLEMTGLDTFQDRVIEIATIVTDKDLNIIEEHINIMFFYQMLLTMYADPSTQAHHQLVHLERV